MLFLQKFIYFDLQNITIDPLKMLFPASSYLE